MALTKNGIPYPGSVRPRMLNVVKRKVLYIQVLTMGPIILPAVKAVPKSPKILPRTRVGTRSALRALKAGIMILKPKLLRLITTPAHVMVGARGRKNPTVLAA